MTHQQLTADRLLLEGQHQRLRETAPVVVLACVFAAGYAFLAPQFFSLRGGSQFGQFAMPLVAVALGQALVMISRGIDLSAGSIVSVGCALSAVLFESGWGGSLATVGCTLGACTLAGCLNGVLIGRLGLPAILVTLATSFVYSGLALFVLRQPGGGSDKGLAAISTDWPLTPMVLVICLGIGWQILRSTRLGLCIHAVGDNPQAAERLGLPRTGLVTLVYAIAGALYGLCGLCLTLLTGAGDPLIGTPYTLNSIAAAVIGGVALTGGVGTFRGVIAGVIVLLLLTNILFALGISAFFQPIAQGGVLVAAIAIQMLRRS